MRKARRTLPIALYVLIVLGMLAVAVHAGKPAPAPFPSLVKLTGGIEIQAADNTGNPQLGVWVTFADSSINFVPDARFPDYTEGPFISNPDVTPGTSPDTPSLWVYGPDGSRRLQYFFCAHKDHPSGLTECQDPTHADYYYCLLIAAGKTQKTGAVVFPAGSGWMINKKTPLPGGDFAHGTLSMPATYQALQ